MEGGEGGCGVGKGRGMRKGRKGEGKGDEGQEREGIRKREMRREERGDKLRVGFLEEEGT